MQRETKIAEFLSEIMQVKIEWKAVFKVLKEKKKSIPRILYPAKIAFKTEGKIKIFPTYKSQKNLSPADRNAEVHQAGKNKTPDGNVDIEKQRITLQMIITG